MPSLLYSSAWSAVSIHVATFRQVDYVWHLQLKATDRINQLSGIEFTVIARTALSYVYLMNLWKLFQRAVELWILLKTDVHSNSTSAGIMVQALLHSWWSTAMYLLSILLHCSSLDTEDQDPSFFIIAPLSNISLLHLICALINVTKKGVWGQGDNKPTKTHYNCTWCSLCHPLYVAQEYHMTTS